MPRAASSEERLPSGNHCRLRRPTPRDEPALLRLNRTSRVLHRGWATPPTTPAQFRAYLERCALVATEGFVLIRCEDDAIVGAVNLSQIFYGPLRSAYLGYYGGAPFAGRGYLREGVGLALRHAFRTLRLHRVEANIQPGNEASRRIARHNGFRLEGYSPRYLKVSGRWRDHERWAVLAEEWPPRPSD